MLEMPNNHNTANHTPTPDADNLCKTEHNPPIPKINVPWTDEQHELLKKCWAAGMSAQISADQINRKFGTSYTRSAIIGRVNRHALSVVYDRVKALPLIGAPYPAERRRAIGKAIQRGVKQAAMRQADKIYAWAAEIEDLAIPFEQRKTLAQLSERDGVCRWPVGEPSTPEFFYCGGKALNDAPYCAGHCRAAYYTRPR